MNALEVRAMLRGELWEVAPWTEESMIGFETTEPGRVTITLALAVYPSDSGWPGLPAIDKLRDKIQRLLALRAPLGIVWTVHVTLKGELLRPV